MSERQLFQMQPTSTPKLRFAWCALALSALVASSACRSQSGGDAAARGVVVVNAPAAGEVRRVFVREGAAVNEGEAVAEIAVPIETTGAPQQPAGEDPQQRAGRTVTAAQTGVEAARAEVVRAEVEVQRLTPLVAAGSAPQGQLDAARADYDRAQQRLRQAQAAAQDAQAGLVVARQQSGGQTSAPPPQVSERIVPARASSAGTVSVVSAREGRRVTAGQPLATLRANQR